MKNLTILRERNHYSRKQMAEFLHVTVQTYSRYEEGLVNQVSKRYIK